MIPPGIAFSVLSGNHLKLDEEKLECHTPDYLVGFNFKREWI